MKNIQYTSSPGVPHGTLDDEFLCHRSGSEWWYATGYLNDEAQNLYSFQFTLARTRLKGIQINILMTALTDFQTGKHYYAQKPIFFGKDVVITPARVALDGIAEMTFSEKQVGLEQMDGRHTLSLKMSPAKPRVWHAEDGILRMGVDEPKEKTYYWSYTNLAASGKLYLEGKEHAVTGKAWFDKQGGPYTLTRRETNWEWFSLRFFDNEEMMLFAFPQDNYYDGTYVEKSGKYHRLNNYRITPLDFVQAAGKKFSFGWKVETPGVKDGEYTIVPKIDGQMNLFYFELLADIKDKAGQTVGYCFVENLPGVYNEISMWDAFRKAKKE